MRSSTTTSSSSSSSVSVALPIRASTWAGSIVAVGAVCAGRRRWWCGTAVLELPLGLLRRKLWMARPLRFGDAVASTRRRARGQAWNCAVRPDARCHQQPGFARSPNRPRDAKGALVVTLGPRSQWVWLLELASRGSLASKSLSALYRRPSSAPPRPPADPDAGRTPSPQPRAHVLRCPAAAAAAEGTTPPQTQEALLPHPEPRAVAASEAMATTRGSLVQTSVPNLTSASTVSGANFTLTKPKGKYEQSKKYFGPLQAAVPRPTGKTAVIYEKGGCDFRFCNLSCLGPQKVSWPHMRKWRQRDVRPVRPGLNWARGRRARSTGCRERRASRSTRRSRLGHRGLRDGHARRCSQTVRCGRHNYLGLIGLLCRTSGGDVPGPGLLFR